jgi:pimeloyl-ACP methyl ester carboxylesterase
MRRSSFVAGGPNEESRISYMDWGAEGNPRVVVCVHGLTRNSRDFDALAAALAQDFRVVAPDVVGRGESDRLSRPEDYAYPTYIAHMEALLAHLGVAEVDWVGTSMGGLIGMLLAAKEASPVRRLVLNDVGPFVSKAALARIGGYVGRDPHFADLEGAEAYLREVFAPFGPLTDEQWRHLALHGTRPVPEGGYRLAYDPAIAVPFKAGESQDVDLWAVWDAVRCPVLVLRGAESDVLPPEVAAEMRRRGPQAEVVEFAGVGHAPALMALDQIKAVRDWLLR